MPFPSLLNFNKSSLTSQLRSFLVSAIPVYLMDILRFILFALSTNKSIVFTDKGINTLKLINYPKLIKSKLEKK